MYELVNYADKGSRQYDCKFVKYKASADVFNLIKRNYVQLTGCHKYCIVNKKMINLMLIKSVISRLKFHNKTELQYKRQEDLAMRKCIRCGQEMIEDLSVTSEINPSGLRVAQGGMFKDTLGKLIASVCPECGYTELYIDRVDKLKKLG